ncbi:uncharacterized protein Dwil_GK27213 [Drosophila willistoni]|uniref:NADP-dependent malic enzyme n=1 Tax=Drosophila willistoni TaxID=7260 RepID=UPI000732895A|nr:NADP-dependent malic enzyme [Drosophila willistoni]KRF97877.1 uncharacterized protein Dwil_GK27213 [Drosophila willistoni]
MICGKILGIYQRRACSNVQNPSLHIHPDNVKPSVQTVLDPKNNKGLGFNIEERQRLGVHGLFPYTFRTLDEQVVSVLTNFRGRTSNLSRYRYLRSVRQRHERLYFRFISECIEEVLPVIYTPTVGEACSVFGTLFRNPIGLFINKFDRGHIKDVLANWPEKDVRIVVVTDGERILGLGDLGANGMGISVGKLELYTALGRIDPQYALPVTLDVGTNNEKLLNDPLYIGIREKRMTGEEYEDFVDEFIDAVTETWSHKTLVHFEDFSTVHAFRFLDKYQNCYTFINDDVQGTASTVLSGFLVIEKITKKPLNEHVFLFAGAGSAATGTADLLVKELIQRGLEKDEAVKNIYLCDEKGLVTKDRPDMLERLKPLAKDTSMAIKSVAECVEKLKPSILVGATGVGGIFTEQILQNMAKNHEKPGIIALSNPTDKSECTAEQAYKHTEGRAIFSSGSPFPPVVINGKRRVTGLANNCFIFPGVGLGVLCANPHHIPEEVYLVAAHTMANSISDESLESGSIYPSVKDAADLAFNIGVKVAEHFFEVGLSDADPKPKDICECVKSQLYPTDYGSSLTPTWSYPNLKKN